jgi:hypothetical protein
MNLKRTVLQVGASCVIHILATYYTSSIKDSGIVDLGFWLFPHPLSGSDVNLIPFILPVCAFCMLVVFYGKVVAVRYIMANCFIVTIRSVIMISTVLPATDPTCTPDQFIIMRGGCRDKMFSGHVAYSWLAARVIHWMVNGMAHRCRDKDMNSWIQTSLWLLCGLECLLLVAARSHYTADVLVGILAAEHAYLKYCLPSRLLRHESCGSPLRETGARQ